MQSKMMSFIEAWSGTAVGFLVSMLLQVWIYKFYGIHIPLAVDVQVVLIFTLASIIRTYYMRRFFNWLHIRKQK